MNNLHMVIRCRCETVIAFVGFMKESNVNSFVYQFWFLKRILLGTFIYNPGNDSGSYRCVLAIFGLIAVFFFK